MEGRIHWRELADLVKKAPLSEFGCLDETGAVSFDLHGKHYCAVMSNEEQFWEFVDAETEKKIQFFCVNHHH